MQILDRNTPSYKSNSFVHYAEIFLPISIFLSFFVLWGTRIITYSNVGVEGVFEINASVLNALPGWFRYPTYLSLFSCFLVVTLAYLGKMYRHLPTSYSIFYTGMWIYSGVLLLFLTTDPLPYISSISQLSSKMAPGTIAAIAFFFVAANIRLWEVIKKTFFALTYICTILCVYGCYQLDQASRLVAARWLWAPSLVLEILALLPIAMLRKSSFTGRALSFIPMILLIISAFFQQTRGILVILAIQVTVYTVLRVRCQWEPFFKLPQIIGLSLAVLLLISITQIFDTRHHLPDLDASSTFGQSVEAFFERFSEDTRTRQFGPFLDKFWDSFPLGAGYPAEGEYNAEGQYGIDSGYLNTTYVAGVPMVLCLIWMLVVPVLRALRLRLPPEDAAIVAAAFSYVIRLFSSTTPSLQVDFLIFTLLAGRSAYLILDSRQNFTFKGRQ